MSSPIDLQTLESFNNDSLRTCASYESSISSSASSSHASIFSENSSVQSSIASSISDDFRYSQEDARDRLCAEVQIQQQLSHLNQQNLQEQPKSESCTTAGQAPAPSYAAVTSLAAGQHKNPRRRSISRGQRLPQLVRQEHRKSNFVDNLVDSATQMVEVIWPLSVVPCRSEGSGGRSVLPLRTYVEETLRRSRTSYSTLQVALYYLVLIKPYVPASDFTMEQKMDCPASRALMCGRRMFLAALILASKYLQDRNYSAKAWSKMSGLKIAEINGNEMIFLSKVNWKLHIPDLIFKKWTEIVLKYTPNAQPPSPGAGLSMQAPTWKSLISLLTPELDNIPMPVPDFKCPSGLVFGSQNFASPPTTPKPSATMSNVMSSLSSSQESTPTPATVLPRYLEPKPDLAPPTPALARLGPLPTPQMTPSSVASSTPAASVCGSRRPSMCSAMSMAQKAGFNRCTLDQFASRSSSQERYNLSSRRPSAMSIASSGSSPDSMISDRSRSSRASSISSVSTVSSVPSLAPGRACLARQATCRNARLPLPIAGKGKEEEGSALEPILVVDDETQMMSSPEPADFTVSGKALLAPHRHSKHASSHVSVPVADKGRKRCRSRGNRRSELHEEVRLLLEEELTVIDDIDEDDAEASPSPAADRATSMLSRSSSDVATRGVQPPASLSRRESCRMPVQKNEGKKRTCCSTNAMSISQPPAYAEVA